MEVTKWLKPSNSGHDLVTARVCRPGQVRYCQRGIGKSPVFAPVSKVRAQSHDAARFRAGSTSHSVAVHDGCTNIPLAAGKAQEDENHSRKRRFRPWLASVRLPGSARTDQVLEDDGILLGMFVNGPSSWRLR
jgi:hypothetical protein